MMNDVGKRREANKAMLSPSHPVNLRKQVRMQLDPSFSVKSYIGAAATLLEKAQMADAQGNLESAFVHYLTTASVASFVPKHTEWPEVRAQHGATFLAYQELMNRTPEIVKRSQAIEAELKEREERAAVHSESQPINTDDLADKLAALKNPTSADFTQESNSKRSSVEVNSGTKSPTKITLLHNGRSSPEKLGTSSSGQRSPMEIPKDFGTSSASHGSYLTQLDPGSSTSSSMDSNSTRIGTNAANLPPKVKPKAPTRQLPNPHVPSRPSSSLSATSASSEVSRTNRASNIPASTCLGVDELWPILFPGFDKQTDKEGHTTLTKRVGLRVLLLDIRPRSRFERGHIRGGDVVCIDPSVLRMSPVTCEELQASMPRDEAQQFSQRCTYDLLVLYDDQTRSFGSPGSRTPEQICMDTVIKAIQPGLANAPVMLRGGFSSWARTVGETGIASAPGTQSDPLETVRQLRVDGYRVPTMDTTYVSSASDSVSRPPRAYHGASSARDIPPSLLTGGASSGRLLPPQRSSSGAGSVQSSVSPPPPAAPPAGSVHRIPKASKPQETNQVESMQDVRVGMSGLRNFGNTCYMNATLQCLSATVVLSRYMLDGTFTKAINLQNPLGTRGALAEAFAQLLRGLWSQQYSTLAPKAFREQIARFAPMFGSSDQQDSQEFLTFLLDGLHEDLNLVQQRPAVIELGEKQQEELSKLPPQLASVVEWGLYRRRNDSVIVDAFQGQLRNQLRCLTCGYTSITYNAFLSLSVPVADGRKIASTTLMQCIDLFVREEVLEKSNAWKCPKCKVARRATKKLSLARLPPILVVHLKRFTYKGPTTNKIDTPIHFPTTGLDLSNYMPPALPPGTAVRGIPVSESQRPPYLYDLYAVTHHFGTLSSGHYTASIKNQNTWFYCDDSRITPDDPNRLQSKSPYVLFFRRRPHSIPSS
ncbi:ubiquitinyl hydrolase 1 [Malassezia yamatoensis]|uniref:Ubiquitin carboxyl-terminal hydrolase n=1 Tax=Malassezia yamatoensis TaxID=253288 RepID=A0AAJ5YV35_9BASI|nr:ubiquitinyl hydrolase 1 [Malassezia yamatoensis]